MWPELNVNDIIRMTFRGTLCGQTILSGFDYYVKANNSTATLDDLQTVWFDKDQVIDIKNAYVAATPDNFTLNQGWIKCIVDAIPYRRYVQPYGVTGTSETAAQANVAGVITRQGIFATRKGNGSLHVPISSDSTVIANGLVTTAQLALLNVLALTMREEMTFNFGGNDLTVAPCILTRVGLDIYQITELEYAFAQQTSRVMRRRTVGLGI